MQNNSGSTKNPDLPPDHTLKIYVLHASFSEFHLVKMHCDISTYVAPMCQWKRIRETVPESESSPNANQF